jgi:hypothetical protein
MSTTGKTETLTFRIRPDLKAALHAVPQDVKCGVARVFAAKPQGAPSRLAGFSR